MAVFCLDLSPTVLWTATAALCGIAVACLATAWIFVSEWWRNP